MASNSKVLAGRAIGSVMVERYIFYPLITLTVLCIIATVSSGVLAFSYSLWWLLLFFPLALWLMIGSFFLLLSFLAYTNLRPRTLKASEKKIIVSFASDFGIKYAATKGARKSPTALASIVVWRFSKGRGKTSVGAIVTEPIADIKDLKDRFTEITTLFN